MKFTRIGYPLLTILLSIVLISTAAASTATEKFDITTKIYIDGELVSSPRVIAYANQKSAIKLTNLSMELVASNAPSKQENSAIKINYDVQYNNGSKDVHTKPQIIVLPNQPATINVTSNSGHLFEMQLLAKRI